VRIAGHVVTNPGNVRENNEDSVALLWHSRPDAEAGMVVGLVADGMGGHQCGEVASQIAAELIPRVLFRSRQELPQALREAFTEANADILHLAKKDPGKAGMGTTGAVVAMDGDDAWCAWVGDSRIYLLRGSRCYQISQDHTVVGELVRSGHLTAEEARNHADRNVLSRALGTRRKVEIDVLGRPVRLQNGDRFLLCSDGLHDLLSDDDITKLAAEGKLQECAESLVGLALERGGYDNVSVVLLEAGGKTEPPRITREVIAPC
jgi:serine/threonine protein phosphatase PrpC